MGLVNKYSTDPEFTLNIRKIPALGYLPENVIEDSFERLLKTEFYKNNEESLSDFINYVEDTYIGRVNRRERKTPPTITYFNNQLLFFSRKKYPTHKQCRVRLAQFFQFTIKFSSPNHLDFYKCVEKRK